MKQSIQMRTWKRRRRLGNYYFKRIQLRPLKTRKALLKRRIPRTKLRLPALPKRRSRIGLRIRG